MNETKLREVVPARIADGLLRHLHHGIPTGDFLYAVLSNDLLAAISHGDDECLAALPALVRWIYNEAPGESWGSPVKVMTWRKARKSGG